MAEVIGPNNRLPGAEWKVPSGTMCDLHPDRLAVKRIQGETDSFGSELNDMCQECFEKFQAYREKEEEKIQSEPSYCELCKNMVVSVRRRRDPSEGAYGPLYDMCDKCHANILSFLIDDTEDDAGYDDFWDQDDDSRFD